MRTYELMTIHRPELAEEDVRAHVGRVETFLKDRGADLSETDFWGKRRFAYEIDHIHEGFYTVLAFTSDGKGLDELERSLLLADEVIRHKVVRTDHR